MLTKIKLFFQIRKFYKIYGDENFIKSISDVTADNLHDVLFDINELRTVNSYGFHNEAYRLDAWLYKLQNQINDFRDKAILKDYSYKFNLVSADGSEWFEGVYIYKQGFKYYLCNNKQSTYIDMEDVIDVGNKHHIQKLLNADLNRHED